MKTHSTNYVNTFIEVAEDCPASKGQIPPLKGDTKSVAELQFELLHGQPYRYTSDDVFFQIYAMRRELSRDELAGARQQFFSRGQPCFRASPLTKRYGWGVHSNAEGKVALYGVHSQEYQKFAEDKETRKVKAMRSKKT